MKNWASLVERRGEILKQLDNKKNDFEFELKKTKKRKDAKVCDLHESAFKTTPRQILAT